MSGNEVNLLLSQAQAGQLSELCACYRAYAWSQLEPTTERNQTMRGVQAVQGRLMGAQAPAGSGSGDEWLMVTVSDEEKQALQQMLSVLASADPQTFSPEERVRIPSMVVEMRLLLARAFRQAHSWWA